MSFASISNQFTEGNLANSTFFWGEGGPTGMCPDKARLWLLLFCLIAFLLFW